jgi:hypothetical protein
MTAAIKRAAAFRLAKVRRVDALVSQGRTLAEALRTVELATPTYQRWRAEIGSRGRAASSPHLSKSSTSIEARTAGTNTVYAVAGSDLHTDLTLEMPIGCAEARTASCEPFASETKAAIAAVSDALTLDDATPVQSGQDVRTVTGPFRAGADRTDAASATLSTETSQPRFAVGNDRRRLTPWRNFAVGLLLAAAPVLFLSATGFVDRARTTEEALERGGAIVARLERRGAEIGSAVEGLQGTADRLPRLEQKVAETEAAIGRLARSTEISQSKIDQLQQQAAGNLAELARLKTEVVATLAKARLPLVAQIDRRQAEVLGQIEALRNKVSSDGAQMEQLQKRVATLSQAPASSAAELQEQRRYFVALTDRLRQEAIGDRTDLARLKDQVKNSSEFLPAAAMAFSRQQTDLIDDVAKLRQEVLASRASLSLLEGHLDDLKQAASARAQPKTGEPETASIELESGIKTTSPTAAVPAPLPIVTPPAATTGVAPSKQAVVAPAPFVRKVATKPAVKKLAMKPRVKRRFAVRRRIPIGSDQTSEIFIDQAEEMSIEQQPAPPPARAQEAMGVGTSADAETGGASGSGTGTGTGRGTSGTRGSKSTGGAKTTTGRAGGGLGR